MRKLTGENIEEHDFPQFLMENDCFGLILSEFRISQMHFRKFHVSFMVLHSHPHSSPCDCKRRLTRRQHQAVWRWRSRFPGKQLVRLGNGRKAITMGKQAKNDRKPSKNSRFQTEIANLTFVDAVTRATRSVRNLVATVDAMLFFVLYPSCPEPKISKFHQFLSILSKKKTGRSSGRLQKIRTLGIKTKSYDYVFVKVSNDPLWKRKIM